MNDIDKDWIDDILDDDSPEYDDLTEETLSDHLHPRILMKSITLDTNPPVDVKLWEKSKRYFWRYDYEGCPKNGPFKSQQQAITDARTFSAQL